MSFLKLIFNVFYEVMNMTQSIARLRNISSIKDVWLFFSTSGLSWLVPIISIWKLGWLNGLLITFAFMVIGSIINYKILMSELNNSHN